MILLGIFIILACFIPGSIQKWKATRRRLLLASQLRQSLQNMVHALKVGVSFSQALDYIAQEGAEPLVSEWRWLLQSLRVGKPLSEIERYYSEKTLEQADGNREEAARILGIGERTLYRMIQDWKLQDKIKQAMADANGDLEAAAKLLNTKPQLLQRKMKKWGMPI